MLKADASSLQGKLAEVYFRFKKIEEIISISKETCEKADETFQTIFMPKWLVWLKYLVLWRNNQVSCGQQINRNNIPSEVVKQYWQRSVYQLFLEVAFADMKPYLLLMLTSICEHPLL